MTVHAPSDRLREAYERRAELEYAAPVRPDPTLDRKWQGVWDLLGPLLPCDAFLDAGCGDGRYLAAVAELAKPPRRIVGSDLSERVLETARAAAPGAELVQANLERLPFEDGEFDVVLCTQVIEHLLDVDAGLRELVRVTRCDGRVVVTTDNKGNVVSKLLNAPRTAVVRLLRLRGRRRKVDFPHRTFTLAEFRARVEAAGLEVERMTTFRFHFDPPLHESTHPRLQRLLNRFDRALSPHRFGDVVGAVLRRPA